jgi:predicted ATPase
MVIIAGQNGSGKSCVFDAIRLLKSVYGGYQANEWQQWMGEFQINLADRSSFAAMFNDAQKELRIQCEFRLAEDERRYITLNAEELLRERIWRLLMPEAYGWGGARIGRFAAQFRDRETEVAARATKDLSLLHQDLARPTIIGEFFIPPGGVPQVHDSVTLSLIFSTFRPSEIGVIDYHGAQRHYGRENVQGINLNLEASEQQRSQFALYNLQAKYSNVKAEMAASFVKEVLAEKAGVSSREQATLTATLQELFETFFPEKKFLGPKATTSGALSFPVVTSTGATHDLDELSSGEKEILYGYLRIRNSAPRFSIILLDEPELHLNPRLIRGLPQFYKKNLGEALGNQLWLVTHSDALLREVVGREGYNVFHMLPCGKVPSGDSQLKPLCVSADLDMALIDLVGDLAAYRPSGKVVIFEGGGDSDFDQRVASALFPELLEHANLVSGTNKARVRALHEVLEAASEKGQLPFKFYAITDADSGADAASAKSLNVFRWDVYHIENYFLEPAFIARVLAGVNVGSTMSVEAIWDELRICAQEVLPQLIRHELASFANELLVSAINLGTDPKAADLAGTLFAAAERSIAKATKVSNEELSEAALRAREYSVRAQFTQSLADGSWVKTVRGRDVLKRFAGKHARSLSYEAFRNLIISAMKDAGHRPAGMASVVGNILAT